MRRTMVVLGALALALTGCTSGEVYPMSLTRVESRLHGMILPAELGFGPGGGSDATLERSSDRAVTWRINDRGATLGWLEAKLDPVDLEHTRVDVDFRMADDVVEGSRGKQKLMAAVGRAVLAEAIDAELDGRAYNRRRVQTQVAVYALAHREELRDFQFDESAAHEDSRGERVATAVSASHPELAVEMRQEEAERRMAAASAPSVTFNNADD